MRFFQKHLEKPIRKILPYSWIIFIFFILLTYLAVPRAIKLLTTISTNLSQLLPDHYPSVKIGNEVKNKFKKEGGGDLILTIQSDNPKKNKKLIQDLASYFEKMPEVERVKYKKKGYSFFDKHKLLYIELDDLYEIHSRVKRKIQQEKLGNLYINFEDEKVEKKGDPFNFDDLIEKYRKQYSAGIKTPYYSNEDKTIFSMWIFPSNKDSSLSYYKKFYTLIESKIVKFPLHEYGEDVYLGYAGSIRTRIDEYKSLINDLKKAGVISLIGIFLLLTITLRRVMGVILIFIPLSCGIILSFALSSFFIDSLNVVTSFLFSILFGLGVDIGIHLFARYLEDRSGGMSRADSIINIIFKTGRSSSVAALTTCATFFILMLNDFR